MQTVRSVLSGTRLGFASALVVLLAACASGPDRPKPAPLVPVTPLMDVKQVWKTSVGSIDFPLSVRVVGDDAYVADSAGKVAAINGKTGADLWRVDLHTGLSAGVGSDGRYTAVVSSSNELIVLESGVERWRKRLSALTLTAPLVAGLRVFTVSADHTLAAFDAGNGRALWQQQRSGDPLVLGQAGLLMAVGDTLLVGSGGRVAGVNPNNGATRWETAVANSRGTNEVERLADVVAGYSRSGDQVCVRAFQYAITCLDARLGKVLWTRQANGGSGVGGDVNTVFGAESDGVIVAFARADGKRQWEIDALRHRVLSTPLVVGKALVVGDDSGNLHFYASKDGSLLNRLPTDGTALTAAPVMAGKTLLAVSRAGGIFAFRSE